MPDAVLLDAVLVAAAWLVDVLVRAALLCAALVEPAGAVTGGLAESLPEPMPEQAT